MKTIDSQKPVDEFLKSIDAENYQVLFGYIGQSDETKKLYELEEQLSKKVNDCAVEQLRLASLEMPHIKAKTKFDEYEDKTDGWVLYKEHYFSKGVTSVIAGILSTFDNKSVAVAIAMWATQRQRFSGEVVPEAIEVVKFLAKEYGGKSN